MSEIYTVIVVILGILAVSDLFVGVSNDAVNFLNSAIGSKAAPMKTILLVASIGMKMNLMAIFEQPWLFLVGAVWIAFHALLLITVAWLIKAPVFFMAVGSQANIGGAASAPIVASAFHPALAPVGVLLAVLGYALGTYAAWFCGQLMRMAAT